jgi:hypothetical protein
MVGCFISPQNTKTKGKTMLIIEANYSKKLGLPGYSSHQYSLTLRAEVSDVSQVSSKSQELHALMQSCVDREIQNTGFLPDGNDKPSNGHQKPENDKWNCSDKQKELILKITEENKLDKTKVEQLAQDRFGKGVRQLNKLEASGLIEELLEQTGQSKPRNARFQKAGAK